MYKANHDHFVHVKRHQIKTVEEAKALEKASNEEYMQAPEIQYGKARDAWAAYLAHEKFGASEMKDAETGHQMETTDITNQEFRDRTTHYEWGHGVDIKHYGGPGQNPETAPNINDALFHKDAD